MNFELKLSKLKNLGVIRSDHVTHIVNEVTCAGDLSQSEVEQTLQRNRCMGRKCPNCKNKNFTINEFDGDRKVQYFKWIKKNGYENR